MLSEIETKSLIISLVVILLVLYIICNLNKQLSYGGNNTIHKLKELDIMFLKMATCPYCIKMESLLLSKNLLSYMYVIDVQTQDGRQLAQKHGFNYTNYGGIDYDRSVDQQKPTKEEYDWVIWMFAIFCGFLILALLAS